ncbi:MAG: DUF2779 domain-containing protein [Anaerolineales bacterium]|nr:DUF2779 domain-containing protein [Anaerolineales bacterium]
MLTKTAYLAFTQCKKQFWLAENQPSLAADLDPVAQRRLREGVEVDRLAREKFPTGTLIPYQPQPEDMDLLTKQAIAGGAQALFQATFIVDDLLVRVDILEKTGAGWHLIEVKSSTRYKWEEHLPDIAFQAFVLQQAGINVTQYGLMHLNSDYRYPDSTELFSLTDVTDDVLSCLPQVEAGVGVMRQITRQHEGPIARIGRHCTKPHECPFYTHCWQDIDGWTIYHIPYLRRSREQQLEENGILHVSEILQGTALGDKRAQAFIDLINQKQITIDSAAIRAEMDALNYPLYFFDFETIDYAIPRFDGCKPYQQVPFQYSCHILNADGSMAHHDFLHTSTDDPRPALVESMLADIGQAGSLIAYNVSFERSIIRHLADQYPDYADQLMPMAERLWDQLIIFRKYYRHYGFGNSNSLKAVLPVVAPDLSYKDLSVQNGAQAQVVWEEMIYCENQLEKQQLINQLLDYCHLDTLAMVKMHQVLSGL